MSLKSIKLAECCISITDGDHLPPPKSESGIPFVTIANINSANQFDFTNTMFVPQEYYDKLDVKRKAQTGDVLYSVVGSFGIPVYIKDNKKFVFQRHIAILRPNEKIVPRFLYYTMLSRDFYAKADAAAIGAAQRTVSLTSLRNIEIKVPSIEKQNKIVNILSVYDDFIENNQKQIKLLEEAAQRLYKEWFVDLRFPGYENTPIVDGVPQGWTVSKIGDIFKTLLGGTPSRGKSEYWENGDVPWINSGKVNELRIIEPSEYITTVAVSKSATKLMPKHTTLVAITGATLGQVSYTEIETCANQSVVGIIDDSKKYSEYIYCYVLNNIKNIIGKATGGAQQHINKDIVNAYPIILPSDNVITTFRNNVDPLFEKIRLLMFENKNLTEVRDRLLPKLMSGELEV